MTILLNCPVCDRTSIESNICPNCETDLTTLRMLAELPEVKPTQSLRLLLPWLILLPLLTLGLLLGSLFWLPRYQPQVNQSEILPPPETIIVESSPPQSDNCGGFYYTVTFGDSLSLIAQKFYANLDNWELIATANPLIQNRTDLLYVGETLFIPNLPQNCPLQE